MAVSWLAGPLSRLGLVVALASAALDQAVKLWLLFGFDLPSRGRVHITPFLDLVMTWNTGISYGLFQQQGPLGQWVLLAVKVIAVALLVLWLARAGTQIAAISIVKDDVPPGAIWGGTPAKPIKQWFREMKTLERLAARPDKREGT